MEYIVRGDAHSSHLLSLTSGPWEVLEDPSVGQAVLCLESLGEKGDHCDVIDATALLLHGLSQLLTLVGVVVDVKLDDLVHLEMDCAGELRDLLAQARLSRHWKSQHCHLGHHLDIERNWLDSFGVL